MWKLFYSHPHILGHSFIIYTFTIMGQSYFLAFFNRPLQDLLDIDRTTISTTYSLATLCSSLFLPLIGKLVDQKKVKSMTFLAIGGVCLGYINLAFTSHIILLFISYFIIRLMGQMTLGLVPSTAISRFFGRNRGKGLSIMTMGKFLGDGILPSLAVFYLAAFGLRGGLLALMLQFLAITSIASFFLLRNFEEKELYEDKIVVGKKSETLSLKEMLLDWRIMATFLGGIILPYTMTGLFFHQESFLAFKDWSVELFAGAFIGYSVAQFIMNVIAGQLIDRFSATSLLPFSMIFFAFALLIYHFGEGRYACIFYLMGVGVAVSMSAMSRMAFYAENFDKSFLGRLRSIDSVFMVVATSAAPLTFALFLDSTYGLNHLMWILQGLNLFGFICFYSVSHSFKRQSRSS